MKTYFEQGNWEPFVYKRLNQLIEENKGSDDAYVVFDFDNTSAIHDIEDHWMIYMLDHFLYKLSAERLYTIMTSGPFDFDQEVLPGVSVKALAGDVYDLYKQLKEMTLPLNELKETSIYQAFAGKIRTYYRYVNSNFIRQAGEDWVTYWFEGYTPQELQTMGKEMMQKATTLPFTWRTFDSGEEHLGKCGRMGSGFAQGLAFPKELLDLYHAFQDNGITTYIVSASPIDLVIAANETFDYRVKPEHIIAMKYQLDDNGKILAKMAENTYITKQVGKTQAIKNLIQPQQAGRQPLAMFGDSMGDYDMMMTFKDTPLNVFFNCYHQDQSQTIVRLALDQYETSNSRFVLQGRDEPNGTLRPYPSTIKLKDHTEVLEVEGGHKGE